MKYTVNIPNKFWQSVRKLRYKYAKDEFKEVIEKIKESIKILAREGCLPEDYDDHLLRRSPYTNYHEYHVYDDDVLVIYFRYEKKLYLRFVEVTDHDHLREKSSPENNK